MKDQYHAGMQVRGEVCVEGPNAVLAGAWMLDSCSTGAAAAALFLPSHVAHPHSTHLFFCPPCPQEASHLAHEAADSAHSVGHEAADATRRAADRAAGAGHQVAEGAREAKDWAKEKAGVSLLGCSWRLCGELRAVCA